MAPITVKILPTDNLNLVLNQDQGVPIKAVFPPNTVFTQKVTIQRDNLEIVGNGSTIVWSDHNGMRPGFGTSDSATLTICGTNVTISDLTVKNAFDYVTEGQKQGGNIAVRHGLQAVAVFTAPQSKGTTFHSCTLSSWQDTLFCDGIEDTYDNCTISGNIDFIFGRSFATFKNCTIISLGPGFVTAPSTMANSDKGLCFENCNLICTDDVPDQSVYLARPWHPQGKSGVCSCVYFSHCTLGRHINSSLWTTMHDSKGGTHTPEESRFSIEN